MAQPQNASLASASRSLRRDNPSQCFSGAYHHIRRRRVALELVRRRAKLRMGSLICDVGCGDGWYSLPLDLLGHNVVGIDISRKLLKTAKTKIKNADFVAGDANRMPFKNDVFDLIICTQLLEHVSHPQVVIGECKRITKDGNFLLFEVPSKSNIIDILIKKLLLMDHAPWTTWGLTIDPTHLHFFSQDELLDIFLEQDLRIIEVKGAVAIRYSLPIISKMFWDAERRWWQFLDAFDDIASSIPKLKNYGAIQTFLLIKQSRQADSV